MSELLCKKATILILSEIVRRCKRQDFAKSSWADDFNPSPWQVSRKGQGGRKGQIQQKCFGEVRQNSAQSPCLWTGVYNNSKKLWPVQGETAGMPNRVETRSARVKILLSHSIDEAGLSTQQWDSCIFLQQWINWGCCMQEIHLKMHPLLEMPSGIKFATFYCKRSETWSHDSQFQIINKRTNKIVSRIWKSCIYIL